MASEHDVLQTRPPELINITVLKIRYLRTSKGDAVNVTVKVEFGDKVLGESPKQECSIDVPGEFNFSVSLQCTYDDMLSLDEIIHKPVVVTVIEVLAKEKKQKEEKTNILGQCCIDLFPLIKGSTEILQSFPMCSVTESLLETTPTYDRKPEIEVQVTVAEPLLKETALKEGNLLTMSVGSLYSPPESWTIAGAQYNYCVAVPVPLSADRELPVLFTNGKLKPAQDKESSKKQKRWAVPGSALGNATLIPDSFMLTEPVENEDGDLKGKEDTEHRKISELEKNRVTWNMERRCYLQTSALKNFQNAIVKNHYWPVEIIRIAPSLTVKGKKEEDTGVTFHGLVFLNLSPLLYPGVMCVKGAFKVMGYSEAVLFEKTKRKYGVSDDVAKLANLVTRFGNTSSLRKGGKEADKKDVKKTTVSSPQITQVKSDSALDTEAQAQNNIEGQQYVDARSYIMIEFCLDKPLIPKRTPEALVKRVAELIPPRSLYPKRTDRAQKAVEDFHSQVASVAALILDEFRDLFGEELKNSGPQTNEAMEDRRQKLVYELNSTGKYFAIKEQLKHSVVKIVREKYLRTTDFNNKQELQTFLSELYVYLIDQMHVSLGKVLALEDQPPIPKPLTDSNQLRHFAIEAEINQNFDLAATYFKERIARNTNDADCWFDFGTFNLYINDITKAEECFSECLSINQKHLQGLLLYGVVCVLSERNETAETFFETATCIHPKSILAWTMLGLFYDAVSNEIGAERAYTEANKLNLAKAVALTLAIKDEEAMKEERERLATESQNQVPADEDGRSTSAVEAKSATPDKFITLSARSRLSIKPGQISPSANTNQRSASVKLVQPIAVVTDEHPPEQSTPVPATSIYMNAIEWLLEVKAISFAERALGHELLTCHGGPGLDFHIVMAKLFLQKGSYSEAENSLNEAVQINIECQDAWALMGHVKYLKGDLQNARHCYERTLSFVNRPSETHSVYLRLASIYLQEKKYQIAKNTFLMACKSSPSCISWLGVGIACYRLGEFSEAEDALSEANILNNNDPEVWAYLSLVCLSTNRCLQAEQAYKYAIKLNLDEGPLLAEIHGEQARYGFGNPAF